MTDATKPPQGRGFLELSRELGLVAAVACGVGSIIGSGIFKKPALMASQLQSPELLLLVWVVAGVMTLLGALSIAEVSGMFREAGGPYVYFNHSYNRFVGYIYGWAVFAVIQTGSIASIAYVFSDSLSYFVEFPRLSPSLEAVAISIPCVGEITPFRLIGLKGCTIALIAFLTWVNYLGVRLGSGVQVLFSALKVLILVAIVALAFALGRGDLGNFFGAALYPLEGPPRSLVLPFVMAMAGAFWAYDAWINVTYMAGEIRNPQRNLPKSIAIAVFIVIGLYLLANLAYLYIIPAGEMASKYTRSEAEGGSYLVAIDVANSFMGRGGGMAIAIAVMVSTFGAVNGTIMMSARVYFAMARERLFFAKIGEVHPRFRTPGPSLLLQGAWSSVLVLSGTFDQLTDMLIFVSWIFYGLAAMSVMILRRRMQDRPRPYRVWGYPYTPLLFIFFAAAFVVFTLYCDVANFAAGRVPLINSLMGLLWVGLGVPGYFYWRWKGKQLQR